MIHFNNLSTFLKRKIEYIMVDSWLEILSDRLLSADVAVAAPLISMGALLGKTTYMQLIIMGIIELIMYTANKYIGEHHLMVSMFTTQSLPLYVWNIITELQ